MAYSAIHIKDDPETRFIVGFVGFQNFRSYPNVEDMYFTWSNEHAKGIGWNDGHSFGLEPFIHRLRVLCVRGGCLVRVNGP
jgi:hypothetical protein